MWPTAMPWRAALKLRRSYWLPMTVAIVLKPDFASTFSRGALRLGGTFGGLVFATALFHLLRTAPAAQATVITALMFVVRCWGPANYRIFVAAVIGAIVLLIAMTGVSPRAVIAARSLNTAIGGAIALAAYWLCPRANAPACRTKWLRCSTPIAITSAPFARAISSRMHPSKALWFARARRPAGLAPTGKPPSAVCGPSRQQLPGTRAALTGMLASSHGLMYAIMALEAGLHGSRPAGRPARSARRSSRAGPFRRPGYVGDELLNCLGRSPIDSL